MDTSTLIRELNLLKEEKRDLLARESILKRPTLTDFSKIKELYGIFLKIRPKNHYNNNLFIYICLALFSPGTLFYLPVKNGLRTAIAGALGLKDCSVSAYYTQAINRYNDDRQFRDDIFKTLKKMEKMI